MRVEAMDDMIIEKEKISDWWRLLSDYKIYAPHKRDDVVVFDVVKDESNIVLDFYNSVLPPKEVFFPQTETLFKFEKKPSPTVIEEEKETGKVLLFGVRPCDARSFLILDKLFYWDLEDNLYRSRRSRTTIIGLACNSPHQNCFCTSVGGNPHSKDGLDVLLTDLGDRYYVEVITEKGEEVIKSDNVFSKAEEEDREQKDKIQSEAEKKIAKHVDVEGVHDKLGEMFDSEYWERKAESCVGCAVCTYLCPTCHCFDITDEDLGNRGRRIRTWDTCQSPEYTVHASGYNPRPEKKFRVRNRIYHKYRYFPDRFSEIACVGCGRCDSKCPVNIDIVEILKEVKEAEK